MARARDSRGYTRILGALGLDAAAIAGLPRATVPVRDTSDGLAWLFVIERHVLLAGMIRRVLEGRQPCPRPRHGLLRDARRRRCTASRLRRHLEKRGHAPACSPRPPRRRGAAGHSKRSSSGMSARRSATSAARMRAVPPQCARDAVRKLRVSGHRTTARRAGCVAIVARNSTSAASPRARTPRRAWVSLHEQQRNPAPIVRVALQAALGARLLEARRSQPSTMPRRPIVMMSPSRCVASADALPGTPARSTRPRDAVDAQAWPRAERLHQPRHQVAAPRDLLDDRLDPQHGDGAGEPWYRARGALAGSCARPERGLHQHGARDEQDRQRDREPHVGAWRLVRCVDARQRVDGAADDPDRGERLPSDRQDVGDVARQTVVAKERRRGRACSRTSARTSRRRTRRCPRAAKVRGAHITAAPRRAGAVAHAAAIASSADRRERAHHPRATVRRATAS